MGACHPTLCSSGFLSNQAVVLTSSFQGSFQAAHSLKGPKALLHTHSDRTESPDSFHSLSALGLNLSIMGIHRGTFDMVRFGFECSDVPCHGQSLYHKYYASFTNVMGAGHCYVLQFFIFLHSGLKRSSYCGFQKN